MANRKQKEVTPNENLLEMLENVETNGETSQELLDLMKEANEVTGPTMTDEMLTELEKKEEAPKKVRKTLDLGKLAEAEDKYKSLSNHAKLKTIGAEKSLEMADKLKTIGIKAIFSKGQATNDMGFYHIGYKIPEIDGPDGPLEYAKAYNELSAAWRKNPLFRKEFEKEAQGEIITLAADGGLFLQFVRPFGESVILEGMDGQDIEITAADWHKEPIGIWKNGGRATKVGHLLGLTNYLLSDYDRKPSDKFQSFKFVGRYWMVLENIGDKVKGWKKNGNKIEMPSDLHTENGYKDIIEWAQGIN